MCYDSLNVLYKNIAEKKENEDEIDIYFSPSYILQ